ncbi:hypothetical protein FVEN_g2521 [Fusarium venenatum]|uniref:Mid2 domain-containing protein n=1 Tax=Fusarium venenatum TaxID=56646 RepID=A0A2L2TKJ4_9HYPO|nr:uncharacterized protein FVRRES_05256 [Fusarium venenatum]KAG8359710.1 hypothetical protein FVEN_g2521 [Fusarium venenatum]KAH6992373.1 hypothetical protein EDB82DRAFT_496165 [Fusarium venenatum]CEI60820.1 unnamed protein product [Fusarium venenatum]
MMRTTVTDMTNSWTYHSFCLLMALTILHTEARPLAITETDLSREDVKSMVHHILKSSELSNSLVEDEDNSSSSNNSNKNTNSGTEKGAIVGGTIAAGIILGVTVFIGILIYKQYRIRRQRANGQVNDTKSSPSKSSRRGATPGSSAYRSWRHAFNHRVSIPDSVSIYSQQSYGNSPIATQVEMVPTRSIPPPTIPQKAAQMLGVEGVHTLESTTPLIISPLSSPRSPNSPLVKHFIARNPLAQNPPQQQPSPQVPSTQGSLPPTPGLVARNNSKSLPDSRARARTSSNCTMSTLGRKLLHDVMKPLPPTKFSPPSEMTALPHSPPPISKTTKPPPVSMNSMKGQKRAPSRRYFVPLFKKNGQLPSPTSPDVALATESGIQEEGDANAKVEAETVLRDSSRAGMFSLGENKI